MKKRSVKMSTSDIYLFMFLFGTGVSLTTQAKEVRPSISSAKSCFLHEISFLNPSNCIDVESDTVRHLGSCSVDKLSNDGISEVFTCIHGHWSGTKSSIATLYHREKRFLHIVGVVVAGVVGACLLFCDGGTQVITKYPPSFHDPCKPDDVKDNYNVGAGETSAVVSWKIPKATDRDGDTPSVVQVGGGKNGGRFEGASYGKTHYIVYRATDSDGLTGHCNFFFTVTTLTCGIPPWPANGARSCANNNVLGSSCQYTCNSGYLLVGRDRVTCQKNGGMTTWSTIPTCERIACGNPSIPEHSTLQCTESTYTYRTVCSILCDKGFSLRGPVYMQCQADGTWSNAGRSTCKDAMPPTITCITPQIFYADRGLTSTAVHWQLPIAQDKTDPNPAIVQTEGPTSGSVLDAGSVIVKYKAIDSDGNESPKCFIELRVEEITCGHPMDSFQDNYLIFNCSTSRYAYGTSCLLSCSAHLPLEGTNLVTCEKTDQSVGEWTWGLVDKPYCREIACPELEAPINGALVYDTIQTRPIYTMMCNKQFDIPDMGTNFNGMFFCTDDGDWTPAPPVPDCIEPTNPRFLNLPAKIFYYGGNCGSEEAMKQIEENFNNILNSDLNPYFKILCQSEETCIADNVTIICGPISERRKRSFSFDYENKDQRQRSISNTAYIKERSIQKRSTHTHLLVLEFNIVIVLKLDNTSLRDVFPFYDQIQMNVLKPAVREMISNGTFDVQGFVLKNDSFQTPSYGEVSCDPGYMLDKTTCKPCSVGYFLNETSSKCNLCPVGHYKYNESDIFCTSCPTGFSTKTTGSKSQSDCKKLCSPGSYSPDTIESCSPCRPGYYQEKYGQASCKPCPFGKTTESTNSNSVNDCKDFDVFLERTNESKIVSTIPITLNAFTFMFWYKQFEEKISNAVLRLLNGGTPLVSVYLTENTRVEIPSQFDEIVGPHSNSSWNHVALTWDTTDSQMHVYLAGGSINISDTVFVTSALLENGTFEVETSGQTGVYLTGLHLLGKVLTETEIANHVTTCHVIEHDDVINMGVFRSFEEKGVSLVTPSNCYANDMCLSSPCNGHVCINGQEGFTCICHGGWSGTTCSVQPDLCINNGCENNATCSSGNTNYSCTCIPGYNGAFCEIPPVDGGWSEWTLSECSRSCGSGTRNRTRSCDSPPPDTYGADCAGDQIEIIPCNFADCPVCKEFGNRYGTLLNCTTDQLLGSKTCFLHCEKDKFLPPGLMEFHTYTCGPGTDYEWDSLDNPPSCVDPVGPDNVNITANVNYTTAFPDNVTQSVLAIIGEQILSVPCFNTTNCQTSANIIQSTSSITFNIRLLLGPDVQYEAYVSSGIANAALQELIDALTYLESTAQYLKNHTNEIFDVFFNAAMYTVDVNSLTFGARVTCSDGFVALNGLCVACPPGTYSAKGVCNFCEKGTYQTTQGQTSCFPCPDGLSTSTIGSSDMVQCKELCSPGSYSIDTMESCSPCRRGYYQEQYGQVSCKPCPSGKTTESTNSNSVNDCKDFDVFLERTNGSVTLSTIPITLNAFTFMFWSKRVDENISDVELLLLDRGTPFVSVYLTENIRIEIPSQLDEIVGAHNSSSWNHLALTWNTTDSQMHVYLAGESVYTSDTVFVARTLLENSTFEVASSGPTGVYLTGFYLLGKVLTQSEIANHATTCHITEHDDVINMGEFSSSEEQGVSLVTPSICNANDMCLSSPCNGHVCINGQDGFTCICNGGWSGTTCSIQPDLCINNGCENNATCSSGNTNYTCICIPGYSGTFCEIPPANDMCLSSPCNGHVCINGQDGFTCICNGGWSGKTCSIQPDLCINNGCENNATCSSGNTNYTCICIPGYSGTLCEIPQANDMCLSSPCNGHVCINGQDGFTCICNGGWSGTTCSIQPDLCINNGCENNATCSSGNTNYTCICIPGYSGTFCEIPPANDMCLSSPCNGHVCINGQDGFTCICNGGWSGKTCSIQPDLCINNGCENNATCSSGNTNYTCICIPGYSGTFCEISPANDMCLSSPCNGHVCINGQDGFTCICNGGWSGKTCSIQPDLCINNGCENNATCSSGNTNYTCTCIPGYSGTLCEIPPANDMCLSSPCNGHVCINGQDDFTCICNGGWSGTTCSIQPDLCINNGCENNATCSSGNTNYTCICIPGYSGTFCEISPVDGGWSEWTSTECSRSCGSGIRNRTRSCDSPPPDTYGAACAGDSVEIIPCNFADCPVCKDFGSRYGTLLNCTTDPLSGSKTCILHCEKDKFLPAGLREFHTFTCGPGTDYVWDSLDNPPSCVDPVGPDNVNITANVNYTTAIPDSVTKSFLGFIDEQILSVPCFNSTNCQTSANIIQSTLSITFNIRLILGPNLQYDEYVSSGIANAALQELFDALTYLESTAQYLKNHTNELFDVFFNGVMYTVDMNSLTFGARITCSDGFVALNGLCVACPPGTYSANGVCNFCEKGTYQTTQGKTSCLPCPDGLSTTTKVSSDMVQCKEITESSTSKKPPVQDHEGDKSTVYIAIAVSVVAIAVALSSLAIVLYKKRRSNSRKNNYQDVINMPDRNYSTLDGIASSSTQSASSEIQNGSDELPSVICNDGYEIPVPNYPPPPYEAKALPNTENITDHIYDKISHA